MSRYWEYYCLRCKGSSYWVYDDDNTPVVCIGGCGCEYGYDYDRYSIIPDGCLVVWEEK